MSFWRVLWKPGTLSNSRPLTKYELALWEEPEGKDVGVIKAERDKETVHVFHISEETIRHRAENLFLNLSSFSPFISSNTSPQRISQFGPQSRILPVVGSLVGKAGGELEKTEE